MDYEDRLIIYIDILGFSNFVNYTSLTKINTEEKIKKIDNLLTMIKDCFKTGITVSETRQVSSFSDLIVISVNLNEINNIDFEISEIYHLLMNAVYKGFLLRGSILYGKLIHTENVIFGPGLIEAFNNEKTIAKYPRIILDDVVYADLKDLQEKSLTSTQYDDYISRDIDGIYYIDLLKSLREKVDNLWQYIQIIRSYCIILLNMIDNPIVIDKYMWLEEKFIYHANENKDLLDIYINEGRLTKIDLEAFIDLVLDEYNKEKYEKLL